MSGNSLMDRAKASLNASCAVAASSAKGKESGGVGSPVPPAPAADKTDKVVEAAVSGIVHNPVFSPWEQLQRVMPNDAWYDPVRAPNNPTQFEVLHYEVPKGRAVIVLNFSFEPYVFSGVGAFASQPVPRNALTNILGFSFTINGQVPGTVEFHLEPRPSNFQRELFRPDKTQLIPPQNRVAADFLRTAADAYGAASGFGLGILPQRTGPFGSPVGPKAFVAYEGQHIVMSGIIYRQVPVPLAHVEANMSGYIGSFATIKRLLEDLKAAT